MERASPIGRPPQQRFSAVCNLGGQPHRRATIGRLELPLRRGRFVDPPYVKPPHAYRPIQPVVHLTLVTPGDTQETHRGGRADFRLEVKRRLKPSNVGWKSGGFSQQLQASTMALVYSRNVCCFD